MDEPLPELCCFFFRFTSPYQNTLSEHLITVHENKTFDCDTCQKKFKTKNSLQRHKQTHNPNSNHGLFICHKCEKCFPEVRLLRAHLETFHAENPIFECPNCKRMFKYRSSRAKHRQKCDKLYYEM